MPDLGHVFNPKDDSLESRIAMFKSVRHMIDALNIGSSLLDETEWRDRLGTNKELQEARLIIENSLREVAKSFHQNDLQIAQERGLLNADEIGQISKLKRKSLIQSMRQEKSMQKRDSKRLSR